MRVRGLHTYPTLSAAVTEFEQMAAASGLLPLGDGEGEETERAAIVSLAGNAAVTQRSAPMHDHIVALIEPWSCRLAARELVCGTRALPRGQPTRYLAPLQ